MIKLIKQSIGRRILTKTKEFLHASLLVGALVALLASPSQVLGQAAVPSDPFVILLKGIYQPVVKAPNLGLSQVDLNDASYSTVNIYPVSGLPGNRNDDKPIGNFYVQFGGMLCAYKVPGGAMAMEFTGSDYVIELDGEGGFYVIGTFELTIEEGTGIYKSFVGGHNHMVDVLHFLADGNREEYCFCNITRP
ncbi:MAG: hypothetical protein ABIZ04_01915 [Opitutus sp.]